jgi:hypothetical protein
MKSGQFRIPLGQRLPGFSRMESGALWCTIEASELQSIATAIKTKEIPIVWYENRGSLERICDLWSTGPNYLRRAA